MLDTRVPLIAEFLKDHQQFMKLMFAVRNLLKDGRFDEARQLAVELDSIAGPHIAFEEQQLYMMLVELGETSVTSDELIGEHHVVLNALRQLLRSESEDKADLQSIIDGFDSGLRHAEHCGSMVSLLTQLDDHRQEECLAELVGLRDLGGNWTEL